MIDKKPFKGYELSRLGLGAMRLPTKGKEGLIDRKKSLALVDYAYEHGVNYFDTAYMYHDGKSEKFVGTALSKYPRDSYFLADKLPIWMCKDAEEMEKVFSNQIKRTGVTYFDNYLLHSLDRKNWERCKEFGAYEFIKEKQQEGHIKNIGFSFHGTIKDLKEIVESYHWDFAQIQLNYLDWENQDARGQYEILTNAGIPVIVMEPVRGGKLANPADDVKALFDGNNDNRTYAEWAIRFVASLPNVVTILSGMNSIDQLQNNISTLTNFEPLTDGEKAVCAEAAKLINKRDVIPCTGCDYCSDCPKGIKISKIFAIYNEFKNGQATHEESRANYLALPENVRANNCINCKKCTTHCPQNINIPGWMHDGIPKFFNG